MGIDKELKEILGIDQENPDDYKQKVSTAYKEKGKTQFMKAAQKANKTYIGVEQGLASVITAVFANRDIGDYCSRLRGESNTDKTPVLIDNIAKYGKKMKLKPEQAVNDDKVMVHSILAAYGSLDAYKAEFLEEVKTWNSRFNMLDEAASNPAYIIGAEIARKIVSKHLGTKVLYQIGSEFMKQTSLTAGDAGVFGKALVKEYAMINARDIKRYERLYNAANKTAKKSK